MLDCSGKFYQQIPVGQAKDLTGQHFGKLTALFRVTTDKGSRKGMWLCQCECGNQKVVSASDLVSKHTQSCGCKTKTTPQCSREDLTNQKFGKLTALKPTYHQGRTAWECLCDCGNTVTVISKSLKSGASQSCGCLHKELLSKRTLTNLEGQRFGKLLVIKQAASHNGHAKWLCQCDCGALKEISAESLLHKNTRSCGCETGSIGENIIKTILLSSNYDFKEQVIFDDCLSPTGKHFRFDFGIYSNGQLIRLIEYDGEFHYKTSNISSLERLQIQKNYDKMKTEYCLTHSIPLVRIPYWERNNITLTTLLDNTYLVN